MPIFKIGWIIGKQKSSIKNLELWKQLDSLVNFHNVKFIKVKGHSDNVYNNECDKMAREQVDKILGGKNE